MAVNIYASLQSKIIKLKISDTGVNQKYNNLPRFFPLSINIPENKIMPDITKIQTISTQLGEPIGHRFASYWGRKTVTAMDRKPSTAVMIRIHDTAVTLRGRPI